MNRLVDQTFKTLMEIDCALEHVFGEAIPSLPTQEFAGTFQFVTESGREIDVIVEETLYGILIKHVFID